MKASTAEGPKPFSVTKGSVTVKGYPLARGLWQLSWYNADGTRGRRAFKSTDEARQFASRKAAELAGQRSHALTLEPEEAADYEAAKAKLPAGVRLVTAVDYYVSRHPANAPRKSVADVVAEHLADLGSRGLSSIYQRNAKLYLNRFASDVVMPVADLTVETLGDWLRGLGVAPKTQKGIRGLVIGAVNFARDRRYIPRELALELAAVKAPKVVVRDIWTLPPADLPAMLGAATPDELPAIAIIAFCPLRTSEVARLDWRAVRLGERVLVVNADSAKVTIRRVVPIPEAAVAWLSGAAQPSGPVWPEQPDPEGDKLAHRIPVIAKAAGVTYRKNGLRHSCISALVSTTEDVAKVSLWAGNSPRVIATSYSARWTKAQGEAWFAVTPNAPSNVIQKPSNTEIQAAEAGA